MQWTPFRQYRCVFAAVVITLLFPASPSEAQRPGRPPRQGNKPNAPKQRKGRDTLSLDGEWRFAPEANGGGEKADWPQSIPQNATTTLVPEKLAARSEAHALWYWRSFDLPKTWEGQTLRLRIGAAAERTRVWLNGTLLGDHRGGATPCEFAITKNANLGGANLLALRVEGEAGQPIGLWQSVTVLSHDEAYLVDGFPQPTHAGSLTLPIELLNTSSGTGTAVLEAQIVANDAPKRVLRLSRQILTVTPNRNLTTLLSTLSGKALKPWSPEHPFLYTIQLAFRQDRDILDTLSLPLGFRDFGFQNNTIILNGSPLSPLKSASAPAEPSAGFLRQQRADGFNLLVAQAPVPTLLEQADEAGMLLVIGPRHNLPPPEARDEIQALILRDRAHPSVLAWDLGNADRDTVRRCRDLDPTRFLLVGPANSRRFYPPGQNESVLLPPGLLP